jgi:hypothetical protein
VSFIAGWGERGRVGFSDLQFLEEIGGLLADVLVNVLTAHISEIAEGAKPEGDKLVVEGVEFTQGRRVEEVAKEGEFMLERAGTGNEAAN